MDPIKLSVIIRSGVVINNRKQLHSEIYSSNYFEHTTQINTYGLLDFEQLCFLNIFVCPLSTVTNLKLLEMKYEKEKN